MRVCTCMFGLRLPFRHQYHLLQRISALEPENSRVTPLWPLYADISGGPWQGCFNNQLMHHLLGLGDEDTLLNSGTYGAWEPGWQPVEFALVSQGDLKKRLLPFMPWGQGYGISNLVFYLQNGQYYVKVDSLQLTCNILQQTMMCAQQAANAASLSLPAYAWTLVTKFFFQITSESCLFQYQFQPFFLPPALLLASSSLGSMGTHVASTAGFISL